MLWSYKFYVTNIEKNKTYVLPGPCHADELFYLFIVDMGINIFHEGEENMVDLWCKWWTNFAKFG